MKYSTGADRYSSKAAEIWPWQIIFIKKREEYHKRWLITGNRYKLNSFVIRDFSCSQKFSSIYWWFFPKRNFYLVIWDQKTRLLKIQNPKGTPILKVCNMREVHTNVEQKRIRFFWSNICVSSFVYVIHFCPELWEFFMFSLNRNFGRGFVCFLQNPRDWLKRFVGFTRNFSWIIRSSVDV
jgi:hypothetical protein